MNRIRGHILAAFLLCLLFLAAPRFTAAQWLPVPPEDLAMKDNPAEPGADAMILYRENIIDARNARVGGDQDEEYIRIKIFTQAGTKEGHKEVPFEKGNFEVKDLDGRTIKPDGTIVKFSGQVLETTDEKFHDDKILVKSITLPEVTPGCIVEFRYRLQGQPGWVHSEGWTISSPMFTREAHFRFHPDNAGGAPAPYYRTYRVPKEAVINRAVDGTLTMDMQNIPAIVEEPLMPPKASLETHIDFYYQYPGTGNETPAQYWNRIGKQWNGELNHFVDKKNALSADLAKTVDAGDSSEVKLRKIYARVLQIRNLSMEDAKTEKELKSENIKDISNVQDVLNRGSAYARQINLLFIGLARTAGFEASELFIAPRTGDSFSPAAEDARQLGEELVWIKADGKEYYLDPAARYYAFGLLPWFETDAQGIRLSNHGTDMATTPSSNSSDATLLRNADLTLSEDGSISGTLEIDYAGIRGSLLRMEERKEDETGRIKDIEKETKEWLPVGSAFEITKLENWENIDMPVRATGSLKISSVASGPLQHLLVPREIFQATQPGLFATQKRVNDVYMQYRYEELDDIKLHAPSGYAFQATPKDQKADLGAALYEVSITQQGGVAEVKRHLAMKGGVFGKDQYPNLRAFFGMVKTNDSAQILLQSGPSAQKN